MPTTKQGEPRPLRSRLLIACAALTAFLSVTIGLAAVVTDHLPGSLARFGIGLVAIAVALGAWRRPEAQWPYHLLLSAGLGALGLVAWQMPGRDVMPLYWATLVPLLATMLLDRRHGLVYAVATLLVILVVLPTRSPDALPQLLSTPPEPFDALRIALFSAIVGGFVGLFDLDRRRAVAKADAARARAEAERAAKARYFSAMSHELRTPLNGVLGMIQVLLSEQLDRAERDALELARRSCEALGALVTDVVADVSAGREQAGGRAAERRARETRVVSLATLADDVAQLSRAVATRKGLTLSVTIAPELPHRALADDVRLRQILHNLVGNAVKFTERGSIRLALEAAETEAGAGGVRFVVEDTGIGMPAHVLATVFEPFRQADASTSRRFGGSGLGLAISRQTVEQLGGQLEVRSTPDQGTRFEFVLALPAAPEAPAPSPRTTSAEAIAPKRVLCVDDNPVNLRVLELMLKRAGHTVDTAPDGAVAVEAVRARPYDAVLMDRHMPVLDGLAATRAIRALPGDAARVPIIAATAAAMPDELAACIDAGMDDVLTKPLDRTVLLSTLARAWDRDAAATPSPTTRDAAPGPTTAIGGPASSESRDARPRAVDALDELLSPALRASDSLRTPARVIALLALTIGLSYLAFAAMAALAGEPRELLHQLVVVVFIVGLLAALRRIRSGRPIYVGTLFFGAAIATVGIAVSETVLLSEILWTSLLPLYATLVLGLHWAAPATALTLAVYVAGFALRTFLAPSASPAPEPLALIDAARVTGFAVAMAGAAGFFDYSRAQAKAEAEAARARAEDATLARSSFLANMTHELRTPMSGVVGMLEILREDADDETHRERLGTAASAGRQLLELVDDILDHARVEHGRLALERLPHEASALLRAIVDTADGRVAAHAVTLAATLEPPTPRPWQLDLPRVRRAIAKLVDDLVRVRGVEHVQLRGALVTDTPEAGRLVIALSGRAPPIAPRPSELSTQEGAGLGVALAGAIIGAMGGRLDADADGWRVELPVSAAPTELPRPGSTRLPPTQRSHPVLVADDTEANRAIAATLVRRLGLTVIEANDGLEALERVGSGPLMAALLDHEMPGLDGLECVRRLRADPRNDTLALVLVTASDEPALAAAAREAGADAVLLKPVSLRDLESVLGT